MNLIEIEAELLEFKGRKLNESIIKQLSNLKQDAVAADNQDEAKYIWCLEQVYKVIEHYLIVYNQVKEKDFHEAWCELERIEIRLCSLRKHLDYAGNKYNLEFIEKKVFQLQKLFPYEFFGSRESVVKESICSVCKKSITLRNPCGHKIGEIYDGEICTRIITKVDLIAVSVVTNPFDKYAVLFPEGLEYDYGKLEYLFSVLNNPFEDWNLIITKRVAPEYEKLGRNDICPCESGVKYKKCCMRSGRNLYDHYHIDFYEEYGNSRLLATKTFNTWKSVDATVHLAKY